MTELTELYPPVRTTRARDLAHIPGDMGLPLLGITPRLVYDFDATMKKLYRDHGEVAKANIYFNAGVVINGPDNVRNIQLNSNREFSNWIGYGNMVGEWFGKALLFRDFDDHRLQRRVMLAAFKNDALRSYASKSNAIIDRTIDSWGDEKNFIALPHLRQLLVHIAAKIFYGVDELSVGATELSESFSAMLYGMEAVVKIDCWPLKYSRGVRGREHVRRYLRSLVPERADGSGDDLMSHMVKASLDEQAPTLSEEDLIDHLSLLFYAGYDTTTTTLLHMMMHIGMDQELQNQLREESQALHTTLPEYDDIAKLTGIHYTFQEALRLYPASPFTLRGTTKECELGGFRIPARTILFIPSIVNHTLPELWKNPTAFDPGRFAPGREEHNQLKGAHYYPFGGGAHKCVGMHLAAMNAKLFIHQLLLKYRFKTPDNYSPRMVKMPMPRPADDLPLRFERI